MKTKIAWAVGGTLAAALVGWCAWLLLKESGAYQLVVRLSTDHVFLKQTLQEWGILAPIIFIGFQALQVIISPIPGEPVGILGGYLFGPWGGFLYSLTGLTLGSLAAFAIGRWLGVHFVQRLVSARTWQRIGFIVDARGAIICAVIFAIPGLPKDLTCYLFGVSTIPVLGLRRRLHARARAAHLGALDAGRPDRVGRLSRAAGVHGRRPAGGASAVLLPKPAHGVAAR